MLIYCVQWEEDGEHRQEFFMRKHEAIEYAQSSPLGDECLMTVDRIKTPRPSKELMISLIKSYGGGYALEQKTVWKSKGQKEAEKQLLAMGWSAEDIH